MFEAELKNGNLRIDSQYEYTIMRFRIIDSVYVTIYRGVIVEAGFDGYDKNHNYLRACPNWDRVIEVLSAFYQTDKEKFHEIEKYIDKRTTEYRRNLLNAANRYLTKKINDLKGQAQNYELLLISILG